MLLLVICSRIGFYYKKEEKKIASNADHIVYLLQNDIERVSEKAVSNSQFGGRSIVNFETVTRHFPFLQ
jgi:hypothetical protein